MRRRWRLAGVAAIGLMGAPGFRTSRGSSALGESRGVIDMKLRLSMETGYPLPARGWYALDIEVSREGLIETKEEYPGSIVWRTDHPHILWLTALAPVKSAE